MDARATFEKNLENAGLKLEREPFEVLLIIPNCKSYVEMIIASSQCDQIWRNSTTLANN